MQVFNGHITDKISNYIGYTHIIMDYENLNIIGICTISDKHGQF